MSDIKEIFKMAVSMLDEGQRIAIISVHPEKEEGYMYMQTEIASNINDQELAIVMKSLVSHAEKAGMEFPDAELRNLSPVEKIYIKDA